ncbi:MAG TPA: CHASE3 domain-containing protein [Patescibacteria group bacterium]|nr:CHASE3 domain-containing protein [Patescibacteria group bacterium]
MNRGLKNAVPWGIGLSLVLVAAIGGLSLRSLAEQGEDARWVAHTHVVIEELETLRAEVLKAENARRGYVLTGDNRFRARFSAARDELQKTLGSLRTLTADNREQQKQTAELQPLVQRRLELLELSVSSPRSAQLEERGQAAYTLPGAELTGRIMESVNAMENAEQDLLGKRDAEARTSSRRTELLLVLGMVATIGMVLGAFLLLQREVKERARAEEEVNQFFEISADLLCVAGNDGYFKRVNPMWEKVLGFPAAELLSKPYFDFIHPEDLQKTRAAAEAASSTGVESFENRYRTRQGGYRWLNWNARPDARRGLVYAAARDVTEAIGARETLERLNGELETRARQLEETNRELEAFTSSVAHDLRAPLRHVDGFSRILVEEYAAQLGPEGERLVDRVRRATQHMGELVDDLLNLSRVSRQEATPLVTDLNPLVREVIAGLQPACQGRHVDFRVGSLPFAECDPGLIRQVFANLLANAVKFTRPRDPAVIEVGQADSNGCRAIFVRDNGVGFSMKYADKLFGVFQRLHRVEDFEGTGVGLVTVQRIVQKHNGRIWADAEVDRGATFYFTLEGLEERRSTETSGRTGGRHARV